MLWKVYLNFVLFFLLPLDIFLRFAIHAVSFSSTLRKWKKRQSSGGEKKSLDKRNKQTKRKKKIFRNWKGKWLQHQGTHRSLFQKKWFLKRFLKDRVCLRIGIFPPLSLSPCSVKGKGWSLEQMIDSSWLVQFHLHFCISVGKKKTKKQHFLSIVFSLVALQKAVGVEVWFLLLVVIHDLTEWTWQTLPALR